MLPIPVDEVASTPAPEQSSIHNRGRATWLLHRLIVGGTGLFLTSPIHAQQARSGAWTLNTPAGEWHMTGRDYSLQRFSPLRQITTANVAELRPVRSFSTGKTSTKRCL
jgi:glucose dehydrogenase